MPIRIGETVGQYRIMEQLGQGGMATVFKAYHASLDRFVAIKVLHPSFKDDETFFMRFQREAQIVAKLEHAHIVPVYDFASAETEPYIVMKFIEGQTLKHRLKENPLNLQEALRILPAVAGALTYAHNQGILHRDIKPSNVMLDKDGTPYLADFGLARIATRGESTMSQDVLLGTPNYISPEQAQGAKELTPATDIYSLGIILYEIVVGRVPFSADTPYAVVHDHIYKPLPMPTRVNPTVPPEVERVLLRALSKTPEDRYTSAVAMLDAFKEAVSTANLNELSATSIRLEHFETASTPQDNIDAYIKATVAEQLRVASQSTPTPAPPRPTYYPTGQMRRRLAWQRRSFWVVLGLAALACICVSSLAVTINALNHPVVRSSPALADGNPPTPTPTHEAPQLDVAARLSDLHQWVEDEPRNVAARLSLGLALLQEGERASAQENFSYAIYELDAVGELLAEAARILALRGESTESILMWFHAYQKDPQNPVIRDDAGAYIYDQFSSFSIEEIDNLQAQAQGITVTALRDALAAQAFIMLNTRAGEGLRLRQARTLLDKALNEDDTLAEAHLIYGNYYAALGETENARDSWRYAGSFADAPQWVQTESARLLNENP